MKTLLLTMSYASLLAAFDPTFMHPEPTVGIICWSGHLTITYADGYMKTTYISPETPRTWSPPTTVSREPLAEPSFPPHIETTTQVKMAPGLGNGFLDSTESTSMTTITTTPPTLPPPLPPTTWSASVAKLEKRRRKHRSKGKKINRYTCTNDASMVEWITHFDMPIWLPLRGTITGSINRYVTTTELSTTETGYYLLSEALKPKGQLQGDPNNIGPQALSDDEFSADEFDKDDVEDDKDDVGDDMDTMTVTITITSIATIFQTAMVSESKADGR